MENKFYLQISNQKLFILNNFHFFNKMLSKINHNRDIFTIWTHEKKVVFTAGNLF